MENPEQNRPITSEQKAGLVIKLVVYCAIILVLMWWFVTYDWPSGTGVSVTTFLVFWFRELIALACALVFLVVLAIRKIRNKSEPNKANKI